MTLPLFLPECSPSDDDTSYLYSAIFFLKTKNKHTIFFNKTEKHKIRTEHNTGIIGHNKQLTSQSPTNFKQR